MSESENDPLLKLRSEMRRGSIVLAVLSKLKQEHYGYSLRKTLNDQGLNIDESTLYPLVRRLEKQGLLNSEWREEEKRNKRFYTLSSLGHEVLKQLINEWETLDRALQRIVKGRKT